MWLRTLHSYDNMTIAVHVSLWLSTNQHVKLMFEPGSYAKSPNVPKSHMWDRTDQKVNEGVVLWFSHGLC